MALQVKFPFGRLVDVFVTHVDEVSGNFFIQINDAEAGNLDELMTQIEEYAKQEPTRMRPSDITVGDIYIAQYLEDERWYRARVLDVKDHCEVFFVDYGNTEIVHPNCLRKAKEKFLELPPQAFECELDGIENVRGPGFQDSISSLKDRILEQELFCRGVSLKKNNILVVNLYTDKAGTTSVISGILSTGLESRPAKQLDMKYKTITLQADTFNDLCVTHVQDPGHFWCQLLSNADGLQVLMDDLATEYSDTPGKTMPDLVGCSVGRPCCAKFDEDDSWYRAAITNVGSLASGLVEVRFMDYGNTQKTSLAYVKELKANFLDLPVQAIECMVEGIQPVSGDKNWSVEGMALFSKLIKDKHVVGLVTSQDSDSHYQLKLFDTTSEMDLEVNQVLIAAGYAAKAGSRPPTSASSTADNQSPPVDSYSKVPITPPVFSVENIQPSVEEKVLVSSVDSPSLFYCQLFRNSSKLLKLMKDINQHYSKLSPREELLSSPSPGDPCCAQFSEDGCWYRAIVKEVSSGEAKVQYVDYGNMESLPTMKIKRLLPRFSELPKQGVECCLNRIRANGKSWGEEAIKKFQAMTEGEAKMRIIAKDETGTSRVELIVMDRSEEKNASEELLLDGSAQLIEGALPSSEHFHKIVALNDYPDLTLTIGQYEDVVVSFTEDPCNFWCQLMKSSKEHDTLMKEIEKYYMGTGSKDALSSPSMGMPCCAQSTEDNVWYRGKITGTKKGNLAEIHFVDYGNSEVLPMSRTRQIKPEYMKLGPQAMRCALSNITPPSMHLWSEEVIQRFEELTMDKELILRADSYDERVGVYSVLLLDTSEGKSLSVSDEIAPLLSQKVGVDIPSLVIKEGTQEVVHVTSVDCKEKFYCQVTKTVAKLDELMNRIENHYASLDDDQEQLNKAVVSTFCAAKYALDDCWYRAKIVSVHDDSISLLYIDYGNSETLPVSRIKTLRPEFAALPCQVFECTIGHSTVGISDDQFKELIFDKEFKAKVIAVKGNGLVEVELLSKETGGPVTELLKKKGSTASARVPSFKLNVGERKMIYVAAVEGVSKFYGQVTEMSESLDELMNELEHHYSSLADKAEALASPRVGDFCVAKFTVDQSWYRAKITNVAGNHFEVLYVDYGNTETLPHTSLKVLQPKFVALPAQAVGCSLSGMSGSQSVQVNRKFGELSSDQTCEACIISVRADGVVEVELYTKSGVLLQDLLSAEKGVAESSSQIQLKPETLRAGQMEEAFCVSANSPMQFWCQLGSRVEAIEQLMAEMNSHYEALGAGAVTISSPAVSTVCCAKFSGDGLWYRARVSKLCGGEVEVQFADYGNSDRVAANEIKVLDGRFTSLPAQAVECSLTDISPADNTGAWSDEATATFEEITFEKNLLLFALGKTAEGRQEVMLTADGVDIASELASQGHGQTLYKAAGFKPQAFIKEDSFLDLFPTMCHSPGWFYCQVMSMKQIAALKELMDQLQEYYDALSVEELQLAEPRVGMPCAAKFTDDNWHRATITKVLEQNSVELYYIDYGNHDTARMETIKKIDRRFMALEAQTICCSIPSAKPLSGADWTDAAVETFTHLVLEKQLVGKVLKKVSYDSIEVELFDTSSDKEDVNISEVLLASGSDALKTPPAKEQPTSKQLSSIQKLHLPSHKTVFVTAVESPGLFFCQITGTEEKLGRLLEELASEYNTVGPGELSLNSVAVGDLCCAKFSEDNNWYRAVVEAKVSSHKVAVRFIDYGNKEDIDLASVKSLKPEFMVEPVLAVQCFLTGLKHEASRLWPEDVCIQFEAMTTGKELMAETTSSAEPYELKLLEDGVNISEELLKKSETASPKTYPGRGKQAEYKNPSVSVGDTLHVFITSIVSPGKFYCQLVDLGPQLNEVMNELNNHYIHLSETEGCLVSPSQGQLCVARYSVDEMWYRAIVKSLSVNNLAVQFVDYGNSETICPSGVKQIKPVYMELPVASVECSLNLSQEIWTAEQTALFEELTGQKELSVKLLQEKDSIFEVKVYEEGVKCISDAVLQGKLGEHEGRKHTPMKLTEMEVEPGQVEEVYVSHVNSANSFYLQLSRTSPQLDDLMHALAKVCAESVDCLPPDLQIGASCCALFVENNAWYRAEVTEVLSELQVSVEYVDYGNTAYIQLSGVKVPGNSFSQLPRQAVHCQLNCSKEALQSIGKDSFEVLVVEKPLTAKFVAHQSGKWSVDLQHNGQDIVETLKGESTRAAVCEESGVPSKQYQELTLAPGQTEAVYLSCAPEPDAFYVQLSRNSQDLEDLMKTLGKAYTSDAPIEAPQQATEGTPCCAMYLEDGSWYRAEITKVLPDSQLEVVFVDYGNSDVVPANLVKELKAEFLNQPKHSVLCKLAISKTAYNEVQLFQSLDLDKALQATFTVLEEDKWLVKFEEEDSSLTASSQSKKYSKPSLTSGSSAEMLFLYAESPGCFYLQRTDNIDELNKLMSSIPVDLPKESPADLAVGLPCLGQFTEDDSWYRAEILTIDDDKTHVQYVDYGNSEWLQLARLRPIKEEFLTLPVQAIKGSLELNKVVDSTKLTEALNAFLLEKVLHVEVLAQNNDGAYTVQLFEPGGEQPVTHSLLLEEGTPNAAEAIPSYYQKTKEYRKPELQKGSRILMYYIAASSPESMYLQFADSENELATLMSEIADVYSRPNGGQAQLVDPHVGQPCCAQFAEDGQWYRAEIVAAGSDGMLTVKFIDYGNCDVVPFSKVKELKDSFLDLQIQTVKCKMSGVCPRDCLVTLDELCTSKKFSVEFVDVQGFPSVILHDGDTGETINQLLMSHGLAQTEQAERGNVCTEPHRYQMLQLNAGDRFHVFCTSASSPHSMQLQLKDDQDKLTAIMTSIASVYKAVGDGELEISNPQAGQACCVKFCEDEEWYRAQVIDIIDSDHINVKFVDFGNTEIVPVAHVKQLNADFLVLPTQSFTCWLAGIRSPSQDGVWSEECVSKLQEVCASEGLVAEIVKETEGSMIVNLFDESQDGKSVAADLVDLGYAIFDLDVPGVYSYPGFQVDRERRFFYLSASSPSSFWCQLADSESELTTLMERISTHYTALTEQDLTLQTPHVGSVCCAKFSEDDGWYRAEVSETSKDGAVSVHFVDYGNSDSVPLSDVKQLAAEFRTLPVQAVECALSGIKPFDDSVDGWSQETTERFEELCSEKTFLAKITEVRDRKLEVNLQDIQDASMKSVSEVLISDRLVQGDTNESVPVVVHEDEVRYAANQDDIPRFQPMPLSTNSKVRVTVSHVENLGLFHCQLVDPAGKLDTLMENMAAHYSFPNLEHLESVVDGQACCAQFTQDDKWYRATVLTAYDTEASVLFVDYGNSESLPVPRIKMLCEEFMVLPPQAIECAIHAVCPKEGAWPIEVISYFEETLADKELDVVVLNVCQDSTCEVALFMEEVNLGDLILQKFPERVYSSLEREDAAQISEEEEEEFQDAGEKLTPSEDPKELAEKEIEVERKSSDEEEFQDTKETLTPPEAEPEIKRTEKEEKEASNEAVTKEGVELEEGEPAATDADPAGEDSGEEFLEASESVHDIESEEDLTAIMGTTSEDNNDHVGTHESSEERMVCDRAGNPAPLPAVTQFMEEILDDVCSSVDTEKSEQAEEYSVLRESTNEPVAETLTLDRGNEEPGSEGFVEGNSELSTSKGEADTEAGQQDDMQQHCDVVCGVEHTLEESASESESHAVKTLEPQASVDLRSEGGMTTPIAGSCENVGPEVIEGQDIDNSTNVKDKCAGKGGTQPAGGEVTGTTVEQEERSEDSHCEILEKAAFGGDEQESEVGGVLLDQETEGNECEIEEVTSGGLGKELEEDEHSEERSGELLDKEVEDGECKPDKDIGGEALITSATEEGQNSEPGSEENKLETGNDLVQEIAGDEHSLDVKGGEDSKQSMAEASEEENEGDEVRPKATAVAKQVLNEEQVDEDSRSEMTGEVSNKEDEEENLKPATEEQVLNDGLRNEKSKEEMSGEVLHKKDEDEELRLTTEGEVLIEARDEGSNPEVAEVSNKGDEVEELRPGREDEILNEESKTEMAGELSNQEDEGDELKPTTEDEGLNEELRDEDRGAEMAKDGKEDKQEELKPTTKEVLNEEQVDEDSRSEMTGEVSNKEDEEENLKPATEEQVLNGGLRNEKSKEGMSGEVLHKKDEDEELRLTSEGEVLIEARYEGSNPEVAQVSNKGDEVKELRPEREDGILNEESKSEMVGELSNKEDEDDELKPTTEDEGLNEQLRDEDPEAEMAKDEKGDKHEDLKPTTEDEESGDEAGSKPEAAQVLSKGDEDPQPKTNVKEDALKVELVEEECERKTEVLNENLGDEEAKPNTEVLNRDGEGAACKSEMDGEIAFEKSITNGECDTPSQENKVDKDIQQNGVHHLDDEVQTSKEVEGNDTIETTSTP